MNRTAAARPEQLEIDFGPRAVNTLKFIACGVASLVLLAGICVGGILLMKPATGGNTEQASWSVPSYMGVLVWVQSGGKISPYKFDDIMSGACGVFATVSTMTTGPMESQHMDAQRRAQRKCRNGRFE